MMKTRIAVISYGEDVKTNLDFVSKPLDVSECELFAHNGIWDKMVRF